MANNTEKQALNTLLANLDPILNEGQYIFATVPDTIAIPRAITVGEFKEREGTTVIVARADADRLALAYDYVAAWITLTVHSSLAAVGLTAAFSAALARQGISCNVVAGYYHDHLFVAYEDREEALTVLRELSGRA